MKLTNYGIITGSLGVIALLNGCSEAKEQKPNIIYILADDLGYGDLSCYGQQLFQTPNIDNLAKNGIQFAQHYSGSTVCAPSRSVLMTGKHTGHTYIRGNKEALPIGQHPLPDSVITLAELMKEAGYVTGAFGKWGLGFPHSEGDPNNQGFDEFYGYNCQRNAHHYYPWYIFSNNDKIVLEENADEKKGIYVPELIQKKTIQFIEKNKDKPFFLYVPHVIPHAEMFAPEEYMEKYRGKFLPENSFEGVDSIHQNGFKDGRYGSQPEGHAAFAAMINYLDDHVGEIVNKLKELGIDKNTLIIFSSDNGPHMEAGADPKFFNSNGGLRGHKRALYEGGIRVPMIATWPNKIKPGSKTNHISAFWDVLPTLTDVAGISSPEDIDGISFLPTLLGDTTQEEHEFMYWEFHEQGGKQAVRKGDWKAVRLRIKRNPNRPVELYNLIEDPREQNNIADQYPEIALELTKIMDEARTPSSVFNFGRD